MDGIPRCRAETDLKLGQTNMTDTDEPPDESYRWRGVCTQQRGLETGIGRKIDVGIMVEKTTEASARARRDKIEAIYTNT